MDPIITTVMSDKQYESEQFVIVLLYTPTQLVND